MSGTPAGVFSRTELLALHKRLKNRLLGATVDDLLRTCLWLQHQLDSIEKQGMNEKVPS